MSLGAPEIILILVVVLLLFGATRLPKLARSVGEAKREFERGAAAANGAKTDDAVEAPKESKNATDSKDAAGSS